jgi:hypothetical protein
MRSRPLYRERYLVYCAPAYVLLLGAGLADLGARLSDARKPGWNWPARVGFVAVVVFLVGWNVRALHAHYRSPAYAKSPEWREALAYVREHFGPRDVVVLNHLDQSVLYYWGDDLVTLPAPGARDAASVQAAMRGLVDRNDRIWLLPDTSQMWDDEGIVRDWLDENTELALERSWRGVLLLRYHTPRYLEQERVPLDARLETTSGAEITLLAYSLRDDEGRAVEQLEVAPGGEVRLTLYWRTESKVTGEYVVFAHLLDGTGWLRGQQDNPPRQGTFPTSAWRPGEAVTDAYRIPLAPDVPSGEALIEVGMYDPVDGGRLPVRGLDADPEQRRILLRNVVRVRRTAP